VTAVALALAACATSPAPTATGSPAPTSPSASASSPTPASSSAAPAASADNPALYAQIESDVQAIRQLRAKQPVDPKVVDEAEMTRIVTAELEKGSPPAVVSATERVMKALGLLAPDASLQQLYLQLLTSQVAGLYDPAAKSLYVLSKEGALGPVERVTFAHEFDHALQDQNFGLANLQVDAIGQGDRSLAHLSLAEGDATLLMTLWAQQHLSAGELLQLLTASNDPRQLQILDSMPSILRETLLFPYQTGLAFVTGLQRSGGWAAVNAAYANPPASTEQLLHPEKYASHEAVLPVDVPTDLAKRLGPGWTVPLVDSLGEFQLRIWLRDVGKTSEADADAGAAGWGGDRVVLATGPSGAWAVAVASRWDSAAATGQFAAAARQAIENLPDQASMLDPGSTDRVTIFVGSDEASISRLANGLGLAE